MHKEIVWAIFPQKIENLVGWLEKLWALFRDFDSVPGHIFSSQNSLYKIQFHVIDYKNDHKIIYNNLFTISNHDNNQD